MKDVNIAIPYLKGTIDVTLKEQNVMGVLYPNDVTPSGTSSQMIQQALRTPYGKEDFATFLQHEGDLIVIVNDGTRPTPTSTILEEIGDQLIARNASFIVATGIHREPNLEEYHYIFGSLYEKIKESVFFHDARDETAMTYLGTSKNKTELFLNKRVVDSANILIIGSVEPHYFAGYTGGRKGLMPGVASYHTIEMNHKHALEKNAKSLQLEGNPVHTDMIDALNLINNNIYCINTVLDRNHELLAVTSGNVILSFYAAIEKADEVFVVPIPAKADIVVTVAAYPMDLDLYQSQKALDNAKGVVKDDGVIILISSCHDGLGEKAFVDLLRSSEKLSGVFDNIKQGYKLGYHKAYKMAEIFENHTVYLYSELTAHEVRQMFMVPITSIQETLNALIAEKGEEATVLFMMDGCVTIPRVGQQNIKPNN